MSNIKCESCLAFTSFKEGDYFVVNNLCGHIFHYECIREWISQGSRNSTCPVCRCSISVLSLIKLQGVSPDEQQAARRLLNFKFVIIGSPGTGKTSLLHQYAKGEFQDCTLTTIGCDLYFKNVEISGKIISLRIWDSGGHERFHAITPNYLRQAHGVLIVYDISKSESMENMDRWLKLIEDYAPNDVVIMLCGNKCDLVDKREIPKETGEALAEELGINFLETSAKEAHNVEAAFRTLAAQVLEGIHRSGVTDDLLEVTLDAEKIDISSNKEGRGMCGC